MKHVLYGVAASAAFALSLANAAFVDRGKTTFDSQTSLEWLDLTESTGLSFAQVAAQTTPGGRFSGYRFATAAETQDIFAKVGLPEVTYEEFQGTAADAIVTSLNLFGRLFGLNITNINNQGYGFSGLVGDSVPGAAGFHPLFFGAPCCNGAALLTSLGWESREWTLAGLVDVPDRIVSILDEVDVAYSDTYANGTLGFFLVREVPEPRGVALLLAGLMALRFRVRGRKSSVAIL